MWVNLGGELLGIFGPLGLDAALKLKSLLEVSPDVTTNIKTITDDTIAIDTDTMTRINQWRADHNLGPLT